MNMAPCDKVFDLRALLDEFLTAKAALGAAMRALEGLRDVDPDEWDRRYEAALRPFESAARRLRAGVLIACRRDDDARCAVVLDGRVVVAFEGHEDRGADDDAYEGLLVLAAGDVVVA